MLSRPERPRQPAMSHGQSVSPSGQPHTDIHWTRLKLFVYALPHVFASLQPKDDDASPASDADDDAVAMCVGCGEKMTPVITKITEYWAYCYHYYY